VPGEFHSIQSDYVPSGYVAVVASGGPGALGNVMGLRHPSPAYQNLRSIPGTGPYPIVNSFAARGFGVGVRQRGGAACIQVTTDPEYTAPTNDQIPV
jgi:hypothetical protein